MSGKAQLAGNAGNKQQRVTEIHSQKYGDQTGQEINVDKGFRVQKISHYRRHQGKIKDLTQERVGKPKNPRSRRKHNTGTGLFSHAAKGGDPVRIWLNPTIGHGSEVTGDQKTQSRQKSDHDEYDTKA